MTHRLPHLLLAVFLAAQIGLFSYTRHVVPDFSILPALPSQTEINALSLGEREFYFRVRGLGLQNAGDSFGRATPLKDYDYAVLQQWFFVLDTLDSYSHYIPSLAAYYYSNTQHYPDTRYIVDYLVTHADKDPGHNWWWYAQAIYLANYKLQDKKLALDIAYKLARAPGDLPIWTRQYPAFLLADLGETEQALIIIKGVLDNTENLSQGELNFMHYFIEERLKQAKKELGH